MSTDKIEDRRVLTVRSCGSNQTYFKKITRNTKKSEIFCHFLPLVTSFISYMKNVSAKVVNIKVCQSTSLKLVYVCVTPIFLRCSANQLTKKIVISLRKSSSPTTVCESVAILTILLACESLQARWERNQLVPS